MIWSICPSMPVECQPSRRSRGILNTEHTRPGPDWLTFKNKPPRTTHCGLSNPLSYICFITSLGFQQNWLVNPKFLTGSRSLPCPMRLSTYLKKYLTVYGVLDFYEMGIISNIAGKVSFVGWFWDWSICFWLTETYLAGHYLISIGLFASLKHPDHCIESVFLALTASSLGILKSINMEAVTYHCCQSLFLQSCIRQRVIISKQTKWTGSIVSSLPPWSSWVALVASLRAPSQALITSSTSVLLVVSTHGTITTIPGESPLQEGPGLSSWLLAKTGVLGRQCTLCLSRSTIWIPIIKPGSVRMLLLQQDTDTMLG